MQFRVVTGGLTQRWAHNHQLQQNNEVGTLSNMLVYTIE